MKPKIKLHLCIIYATSVDECLLINNRLSNVVNEIYLHDDPEDTKHRHYL